jgi:hypothetical protein
VKSGGDGNSSFNTTPYRAIAGNDACAATAYGGFGQSSNCNDGVITATLPVRYFGNGISPNNNTDSSAAWEYYEIFMNESLMQRANNGSSFGEVPFTNDAQWSVTVQSGGNFTTATGNFNLGPAPGPGPGDQVPGPLPVLGAGAALGWSRKLRRRIKDRSAATPKPSI